MADYNINLYYVLGFIDGILFLWALFQLIRIQIYSRRGVKNLKAKRIFHLIIAVAMFIKSGFFFSLPSISDFILAATWFDLSSILLFFGYGCLLTFWMELYSRFSTPQSTSKDFWNKWKPRIILFTIVVMGSFIAWIFIIIFWAGENLTRMVMCDLVSVAAISGLFLVAGFGFFILGILLFLSFKKLGSTTAPGTNGASTKPLLANNNSGLSQIRRAPPEAIRAAVVGTICTVCFCIRSVITLYSIREAYYSQTSAASNTFNLGWEFSLAYFFATEILPTILMMFRLRKIKRKKGNASAISSQQHINSIYSQYSPITNNNNNPLVNNNNNNNNSNNSNNNSSNNNNSKITHHPVGVNSIYYQQQITNSSRMYDTSEDDDSDDDSYSSSSDGGSSSSSHIIQQHHHV